MPSSYRAHFPIFNQNSESKPTIYLDSAATTQRPYPVLQAISAYHEQYNANIHRGLYGWSERASAEYEEARAKIGRWINAPTPSIIFTRNTTESINLVAYSWGLHNLKAGDELLITEMEHHANIVPWQQLCQRTGATLRAVPFLPDGTLDLDTLDTLLNEKTRLFAFTAVSNVFGTRNPVADLVQKAHRVGALALVDGAQAVPHQAIDVQAWDCDFLAFSGHKMVGPTGIGVLYGKTALLEQMPPFLTGGDMMVRVTLQTAAWNDLPHKFEAGTPHIAGAIGLGAAVDFLQEIGMEAIAEHERKLTEYAWAQMSAWPQLRLWGPPLADRVGVIAFSLGRVHPHDVAQLLAEDGIAIRGGHHCAMPLHQKLGLMATARVSFYLYNEEREIDLLMLSLVRTARLFGLPLPS